MKKILIACGMGVLFLLSSGNSFSQAKKAKAKTPAKQVTEQAGNKGDKGEKTPMPDKAEKKEMPSQDEMMKAWMEFSSPAEMHKWMEGMNGTWEGVVLTWMDPSAPPSKEKATNVQTSAMGGRYFIGNFSSNMMGMPFEGMSIMGYDNGRKVFVSTWIDNMGTGIIKMEGTYDEESKTLRLKGKQTDPITHKETDIREEMKMTDNDNYVMTMYGAGMDGKEMKFMEGTFTRKK
ncbi:MAG: DUF1579 domain-containing protein [Ferruginibacter sp.]